MKPIVRVLFVYVVSAVGLTAFAFYIVFPVWFHLVLSHSSMNSKGALYLFLAKVPQYFIYALVVLLFYVFVARPYHLHPLFRKGRQFRRGFILALCILAAYASFSPFDFMLAPINAVGILTFMITGTSEEWVYRGVIVKALKERIGITWAIIISAVLFMLSHWGEVFVQAHDLSLKVRSLALGQDFLFGLVFGVIVWRSRSILWAAFLHCMADWQPYLQPGRHWMLTLHTPWMAQGLFQIYIIGLVGAEIVRLGSRRKVSVVNGIVEGISPRE